MHETKIGKDFKDKTKTSRAFLLQQELPKPTSSMVSLTPLCCLLCPWETLKGAAFDFAAAVA